MVAADGDAESPVEPATPAPEAPAPEPTGEYPAEDAGSPPGAPPHPGGPPPGWAGWAPPRPGPPSGPRGPLHSALLAWVVAGVLALAVVGLSVGLATTTSGPIRVVAPAVPEPSAGDPGTGGAFGPGSGGTFGPVDFVAAGTVASLTGNGFTLTTVAGRTVTVNEQTSTTYYQGPLPASSDIVVKGARVAVEGARNGDTVTADRVFVFATGRFLPNGP